LGQWVQKTAVLTICKKGLEPQKKENSALVVKRGKTLCQGGQTRGENRKKVKVSPPPPPYRAVRGNTKNSEKIGKSGGQTDKGRRGSWTAPHPQRKEGGESSIGECTM